MLLPVLLPVLLCYCLRCSCATAPLTLTPPSPPGSDDELEEVYNILHSPSPLSPLLKSLVLERSEPPLLQQRGRSSVMHRVRRGQLGQGGGAACLRGWVASWHVHVWAGVGVWGGSLLSFLLLKTPNP